MVMSIILIFFNWSCKSHCLDDWCLDPRFKTCLSPTVTQISVEGEDEASPDLGFGTRHGLHLKSQIFQKWHRLLWKSVFCFVWHPYFDAHDYNFYHPVFLGSLWEFDNDSHFQTLTGDEDDGERVTAQHGTVRHADFPQPAFGPLLPLEVQALHIWGFSLQVLHLPERNITHTAPSCTSPLWAWRGTSPSAFPWKPKRPSPSAQWNGSSWCCGAASSWPPAPSSSSSVWNTPKAACPRRARSAGPLSTWPAWGCSRWWPGSPAFISSCQCSAWLCCMDSSAESAGGVGSGCRAAGRKRSRTQTVKILGKSGLETQSEEPSSLITPTGCTAMRGGWWRGDTKHTGFHRLKIKGFTLNLCSWLFLVRRGVPNSMVFRLGILLHSRKADQHGREADQHGFWLFWGHIPHVPPPPPSLTLKFPI